MKSMATITASALCALSGVACGAPCSQHLADRSLELARPKPHVAIDAKASELHGVVAEDGTDPTSLRDDVAKGIASYFDGAARDAQPGRFRLTVLEQSYGFPFGVVPCVGALVLVGCPAHNPGAHVVVELETGGQVFRVEKEARVAASLYYNARAEGWGDAAAISAATAEAMEEIIQQMEARGGQQ